jgi:hypothetical protein
MYGPTCDNYETWRIKTSAELETLIKRENFVRLTESHRLQGAAHAIRMVPSRTVKKINGMGTMLIKSSRKAKTEMERPSGREFKEDESEKLEREV